MHVSLDVTLTYVNPYENLLRPSPLCSKSKNYNSHLGISAEGPLLQSHNNSFEKRKKKSGKYSTSDFGYCFKFLVVPLCPTQLIFLWFPNPKKRKCRRYDRVQWKRVHFYLVDRMARKRCSVFWGVSFVNVSRHGPTLWTPNNLCPFKELL